MIFQHTIGKVLSGEKTVTSRVWKDNYIPVYDENRRLSLVTSAVSGRKLYYPWQEHKVQPARGKKGVACIRIVRMWRGDVRDHNSNFVAKEGFANRNEFITTWQAMHDDIYDALVLEFELIETY